MINDKPKLDSIQSICVKNLAPSQLIRWFIDNNVSFETEFQYDLSQYHVNFYNMTFVSQKDTIHFDECSELLSVFPNIIIVGVSFIGSPSYGTLKMMFDECGLKYRNLKRVYIESHEMRSLDISILSECIHLVKFSAENYDLDNADVLLRCVKLRSLSFRSCSLDFNLKLSLLEKLSEVIWINTIPKCDIADVICGLKSVGLSDDMRGIFAGLGRNKIRRLEIGSCDEDVWRTCENVRNLKVRGNFVLKDGFGFGKVKKLEVRDCEDLKEIDCSGLMNVKIVHCYNFAKLTGCGGLRVMCIDSCPNLIDLIGSFDSFNDKLMVIDIKNCVQLCVNFSMFERCEELSAFTVKNCERIFDLKRIGERHKKLRMFALDDVLGVLNVEELYGCNGLAKVWVGCSVVENIEKLGSGAFPDLVSVVVSGDVDNLSWLSGLKQLENFGLEKCSNVKSLKELELCRNLCWVRVSGCSGLKYLGGFECKNLYVKRCEKLCSLKGVGSLRLKNVSVKDCPKFKHLGFNKEFRCLKGLYVHNSWLNYIDDVGMCPNLERIEFYNCAIFNVFGLENCVSLREVNITDCNMIFDLMPLSKCLQLKWLCVVRCMNLVNLYGSLIDGNIMCEGYVTKCPINFQTKTTFIHKVANCSQYFNSFFGVCSLLWWGMDVPDRMPSLGFRMCGLNEYQICTLINGSVSAWNNRSNIVKRINKCDWTLIEYVWVGYFGYKLYRYFVGILNS